MGICISVASSEIHGIPQVHDENVMIFEASKVQNETKRLSSVYSKQGTKGLNQDAASLYQDYGMEDGTFCGVYDGHGRNGHIVSKIVNNTLPSLILSQKNALEEIDTTKNGVDNKQNKFSNNFLKWKEAILGAFNVMDEEVKLQENLDSSCSGTTAVVVIRQGEGLVIVNLGDSRAILGTIHDEKLKAIQLTTDLKPGLPCCRLNLFIQLLKIAFAKSQDMDPKFTEVSQLFNRFKAAFLRNDFDSASNLLSQLKVLLTGFRSLPPLFADTPNAVQELTIARDIYEHAVVLSVKIEDQDAFERDFFQLKPYYTDARNRLPQSPQEYPILGLNLLRLLVQNRIAEFHTELELLTSTALENPCIKHAVELEQSFMEGAYNRVLSARQTVPHETYVYFMDLLAKTIRDEIAGCSEKAYDYLSINDAKQMLLFSKDQELLEYIKEEHPEWEIKNGSVYFQKAKDSAPCKEIPSLQLINQTLSYARELERIV